jgi:hypothetical protein
VGISAGQLDWETLYEKKKRTLLVEYLYVGEALCKILEGIEIVKLSWEALLVKFLGMRYWGYLLEHF